METLLKALESLSENKALFYVGQGIGVIALLCAMASYQMKSRKGIVTLQIVGCTLFAIHFLLIGALTGALLNVLAACRAAVFFFKDRKWCRTEIFVPLFIVLSIAAVIPTWDGPLSLLPMAGMICTTFSIASAKTFAIRMRALPSSPLWIVYNAINKSVAGVVTEVFVMTSIVVALIRFHVSKEKNGAGGGD